MRYDVITRVLVLLLALMATMGHAQTNPVVPPDWVQQSIRGVDASVGDDGQRWIIGTDGRAYRWVEAKSVWQPHGTRNDLARIDVSKDGAAALTKTGELFVTSIDPLDGWRPTGMRATDVGLGNGQIWLADAFVATGGRSVVTAAFDASAQKLAWRAMPGRLERVDVDPQGRPWGLDKDGRLFVYANQQWTEDTKAPPGSDIGVGSGGAVYVVGRQIDAALGGGALNFKNPRTGEWSQVPGRLLAAGVERDGRAFGVNSLQWVISSTRAPALVAQLPLVKVPEVSSIKGSTTQVRLADLVDKSMTLPPSLVDVPVRVVRGNLATTRSLLVGETVLNGLKTTIVRYTPSAGVGNATNLLMGHEKFSLADYVPDLQNKAAESFWLGNGVIWFVPAVNALKKPTADDAKAMATAFKRSDMAEFEPAAGTSMLATVDMTNVPGGVLATRMLGLGTQSVDVLARNLDPAFFAGVSAKPVVVAKTVKELSEKYGSKFIDSLSFEAPAKAADGKKFGPGKIKNPIWFFSLAQTDSTIAMDVGVRATLTLDVTANKNDSLPKISATATSLAAQSKVETLELNDVRMVFSPIEDAVTLNGTVTRAAASKIASLKGFELSTAAFNGQFTVTKEATSLASLSSFEKFDLAFNAKGKIPSVAGAASDVDYEVSLSLNETRDALEPKVVATGGITLANIVGTLMPGADKVKLARVEWTPNAIAGEASLYGLPVKAVLYKTASMPAAIVGLQHQALDLGSYIPKIRNTSLGSFGLANAVMFAMPDNAQAVAYATRADLPDPLAALLDREAISDEDIFPLTIKGGVNVIGQYGSKSTLENDSGAARKVLSVFGMDDQTYVVKGSFKTSALKNPGFTNGGLPRAPRVSARQASCAVTAVGNATDKTGLDIGFKLPNFKPAYAGASVKFSSSSFALKEIDGQLEPAITTLMTLSLPVSAAGIKQLAMAAKLRAQGDLDVLCRGVTAASNVEVAFAGSTALNLAQVGNAAFTSLERVTQLNAPAPTTGAVAVPVISPDQPGAAAINEAAKAVSAMLAKSSTTVAGWSPAFGLPFLEIRKYASAGTFTQKDGKRSVTSSVWTQSKVGSQLLDVLGSVTFEAEAQATEYKLADWLFRMPGPVQLTGLPGVAALANAAPTFELGDLTVRDLELSPKLMVGTLSSTTRNVTGTAVVAADTDAGGSATFQVFAGVNRFQPNMLLKPAVQLPGTLGAVTLGKTFFALRAGPSTTAKLADLPAKVSALFKDAVGDLVADETEIPLVQGISVAGRLNPTQIPDSPVLAPVKAFFDTLGMTTAVPVFGGVQLPRGAGAASGFLDALLPSTRLPGVAQAELRLSNTRLSFANLAGNALRADTDISFIPPASLGASVGGELKLKGALNYARSTAGNTTVSVSGMTTQTWSPSLGFADLVFGNLGVEVAVSKNGTQRSSAITLLSDASLRGVDVRARLGLSSDGSGTGGSLLELVAREEGKLLSLDNIIKTLPLLPSNYALINPTDYVSVGARGILLATEAGSGRVSLAAEDVKGKINGQEFSGQLAIAGLASAQPVLFISNDTPWTPARIFPSVIPMGPFADLALPEGLIILSPAKLDAKASDLHPRIYDKVFAKLYGARDAAKVLVNDGLTVVAKVNLTKSLPAAMQSVMTPITGWLPISGDMLIGAGVDASSGGLGFYADVNGLTLPIPAPFNTFVSSAGGRVQLFFKTAGASGAGTEAGLTADVKLGVPRLDTPTTIQKVDASISLSAKSQAGAAPEVSVAAQVPGAWPAPAGLEGFSLTDTAVAFGLTAGGTTVNISTEKARFRQSDGSVVSFLLDLNTAWAGGAPTQLSVQFAKSPDVNELVMSPALQAELSNSVFQLAFKGGSSLFSSITSRLGNAGLDTVSKTALSGIGTLVNATSGGMMTLIRNSPLAMIGVRNPVIFFATPGNELPEREGVERPPFGLGLQIKGTLILNVASKSLNMADGDFKINLKDGFYVRGKVKPPAPFSDSNFSVSGNMPLIATQGAGLNLSGKLELPGLNMLELPAYISGNFNFRKPAGLNADLDVSSSISLAGLASRDAYFTIRGSNMKIYSAAGPCIDVPIKLDGNVGLDSLTNPTSLLTIVQPSIPDPIECAQQLGKALEKAAVEVAKAAVVVGKAFEQGGKAALDAAKQGADAARRVGEQAISGAINAATQIVSVFGGSDDKKVCNARIEQLRLVGNVLSRATAQDMVDNIYLPAVQAVGKAKAASEQYRQYGAYISAMDTYGAMSAQWNSRATVGNSVSSQEVSSGWLNSYQHTSTLDAYASTLAKGTLDMEHLATWARVYAEGYDNGRLPEANALWHRCAAVWNADVPLRTAQAWSLPNKTHAVWTPNPEYTDLINRLKQRVQSDTQNIDKLVQDLAAFTQNWPGRAQKFQDDLVLKMHLSLGKQASQAVQDFRASPARDLTLKPYVDAYDEAIAAMVKQLAGTLDRSTPNRSQGEVAVYNVQLAAYRLKLALLPQLLAQVNRQDAELSTIQSSPTPLAGTELTAHKAKIEIVRAEIASIQTLTAPVSAQERKALQQEEKRLAPLLKEIEEVKKKVAIEEKVIEENNLTIARINNPSHILRLKSDSSSRSKTVADLMKKLEDLKGQTLPQQEERAELKKLEQEIATILDKLPRRYDVSRNLSLDEFQKLRDTIPARRNDTFKGINSRLSELKAAEDAAKLVKDKIKPVPAAK